MDHERFNILISKLTVDQIASFTDDEIKTLSMERPGHQGVYGFLLDHRRFSSQEHIAKTIGALMRRLGSAK